MKNVCTGTPGNPVIIEIEELKPLLEAHFEIFLEHERWGGERAVLETDHGNCPFFQYGRCIAAPTCRPRMCNPKHI